MSKGPEEQEIKGWIKLSRIIEELSCVCELVSENDALAMLGLVKNSLNN